MIPNCLFPVVVWGRGSQALAPCHQRVSLRCVLCFRSTSMEGEPWACSCTDTLTTSLNFAEVRAEGLPLRYCCKNKKPRRASPRPALASAKSLCRPTYQVKAAREHQVGGNGVRAHSTLLVKAGRRDFVQSDTMYVPVFVPMRTVVCGLCKLPYMAVSGNSRCWECEPQACNSSRRTMCVNIVP